MKKSWRYLAVPSERWPGEWYLTFRCPECGEIINLHEAGSFECFLITVPPEECPKCGFRDDELRKKALEDCEKMKEIIRRVREAQR